MFGNTLIASQIQENDVRGMISNEAEDTSGRTSAEIERVIYARVSSFDFLERAIGAERQEQWSVKVAKTEENAGSGSIRVRKVTNLREPGSAVQYILTSKLDIGQKGSSAETSEQSTVDQFNIFKYLANKGMLKDRYVFPIDGSDCVWEVDCFPKPGALYGEWVKIDLEDWPSGKELPQLPFTAAETMDGDQANQTEETKAKISRLYQESFLLANTNEPLGAPGDQSRPYDHGQPGVAADGGEKPPGMETQDDHNAEADAGADDQTNTDDANKGKEGEGDGTDNKPKEGDEGFAEGLGEATKEAFSSAGQTAVVLSSLLIPILGPLTANLYGKRGADAGIMVGQHHTKKTKSFIDPNGRKTTREEDTGSFSLSEVPEAKDYIGLLERAVKEMTGIKRLARIEMALWPQKDGRIGILDIKTNSAGETSILTKNNPGKLKWFSLSMAGKRVIKLVEDDVSRFKFNGRTISCPFEGKTVEFDVGQLRHLKYQTEPKNDSFEIVEYNFDA